MQLLKRMAGIALALFVVCASLILVSGWTTLSHAQGPGNVVDTGNKDFGDPEAGDPDAPDGDDDPTAGTISSDVSAGSGSAGPGVSVGTTPETIAPMKRGGAWAHWMQALKLWIRLSLRP